MIYRYAKIPYAAAESLGLAGIRRKTADGQVIVNEGDLLATGKGGNFQIKVKRLGGKVLTAREARSEIEKTL